MWMGEKIRDGDFRFLMNIFVLDLDHRKCARYHCDDHMKMILEAAQMMSTVLRLQGIDAGYKITHPDHKCTRWIARSMDNWLWIKRLAMFLNNEYVRRYDKNQPHKSWTVIESLPVPDLPRIGLTPFALAMPPRYRSDDPVASYREYYRIEKKHLHYWRKTPEPPWL